jgi:integrase
MTITTVEARSKLKPRRAPYWHKLSSGKHLGYRKMKSSSQGTWLAQAYDDATHKQVRRSLGSFDSLPGSKQFDAAIAAANTWFEHLKLGGDTKIITVSQACQQYVSHLQHDRPKTALDAEARFQRWVYKNKIGLIELPKLTDRHVKTWRNSLSEEPVIINPRADEPKNRTRSPASVNRDMTALRAALNHAHKERAVTTDMAWKFALTPNKNANGRRDKYLDREQRKELINKAPTDLACFLRGLSLVPVRPGALAQLVVANFDRRLGILIIGTDKAGGSRKIKLPAQTAEFFALNCRGKLPTAPLLSRSNGKAWNKDSWKDPIRTTAAEASLGSGITAYTLRHSVITDLVTNGLDLLTVAQLSGTSVLMIEKHYGHYRADLAAAALANLNL